VDIELSACGYGNWDGCVERFWWSGNGNGKYRRASVGHGFLYSAVVQRWDLAFNANLSDERTPLSGHKFKCTAYTGRFCYDHRMRGDNALVYDQGHSFR